MTSEEYRQLPLRDRMLYDFFVDLKREMRRIADSLERLAGLEDDH